MYNMAQKVERMIKSSEHYLLTTAVTDIWNHPFIESKPQAIWQQYLNNIQHFSFQSDESSSFMTDNLDFRPPDRFPKPVQTFIQLFSLFTFTPPPSNYYIIHTLNNTNIKAIFCETSFLCQKQLTVYSFFMYTMISAAWEVGRPGEEEGGLSLSPRPTHFLQSSVGNVF